MKNIMNTFIKALYAGLLIGFGGIVYLSVENKIAGSFLFSFGLLTIVTQKFNLYTGKIGFVSNKQEALDIPVIILGNLIGTWIIALLGKISALNISTTELWNNKISRPVGQTFVLSVFCGIMMYLAIDNFHKSQKNVLFVILPVMIFILSGFEHSVANMFYCFFAGAYSAQSAFYLFVMICGNAVGALCFHNIKKYADKLTL